MKWVKWILSIIRGYVFFWQTRCSTKFTKSFIYWNWSLPKACARVKDYFSDIWKRFSKRIILGKINWRRTNVVQDSNSGNEFGHKICSKYQDIFYKLLSCLVRMFNVQTIDIFWDDMSLIWKKCMQLFDDIFASCISH